MAPDAVARARAEAKRRDLQITFAVADLRQLTTVFATPFAAVIACDNAVPHLLSDAEIRTAFAECRRVLEPGGALLLSSCDYAAIERRSPDVRPYGSRTEGDCRHTAEQTWRWDGDQYDLMLQFIQQCGSEPPVVQEFHSRYYAVELPSLERLLRETGFERITRRDEHFFQPLLVASLRLLANER